MAISSYYDPDLGLDRHEWLALSDQDRQRIVLHYHLQQKIDLPNLKLHSLMHVNVENLLSQVNRPVTRALARLIAHGLSRHEAIHALAAVCWAHPLHSLPCNSEFTAKQRQLAFNSAIDSLTVESWNQLKSAE